MFVLASASPARLTTLRHAGIEPRVVVSDVDEDAVLEAARGGSRERGETLAPADAVLALARAKAQAVAATEGAGQLILGCDSMLEIDGKIYGKPASPALAIGRWQMMRGRSGVLHSGHWLVDQRSPAEHREVGRTGSTVVHFADLSDEEIEAYVATGEPLKVAGAFTVDGLGGPYVRSIEGDFHNVVGLSLPLLRDLLAECGVAFHDLRTVL